MLRFMGRRERHPARKGRNMSTRTGAKPRILACVGVLLLAGVCAAQTAPTAQLQEKLKTITIPEIDFRAANIYDVMSFLADCSQESDQRVVPKKEKGLNIVLSMPPCHGGGVPLITFSAKEISLGEALRVTTMVAGLEYDLESNWVHVHTPVKRGQALPALQASTPADKALEKLIKAAIVPEFDFRQITITQIAKFIEREFEKYAESAGEAKGLRVHVDLQPYKEHELPLITFAGRRMSLYDVVRIAACATMMECRIVEGDVRFRVGKIDRPRPPFLAAKDARGLTFDTYPDLVGSESVRNLLMVTACHLMGADCAWTGDGLQPVAVLSSRTRPTDPHYRKDLERSRRTRQLVRTGDIHEAYMNLMYGLCDMVLAERKPNDTERRFAEARGAAFDIRPVALDALVFTVNSENPVKSLTGAQLHAIYSGEIKNWKDAGGPDAELRAFHRDRNARSHELMTRLVMKDRKAPSLQSIMTMGMGGPFNRLYSDKQGLGYSSFYHELRRSMSGNRRIVPVSVDGVEPTPATLSKRTYPYVTEVYLVTQKDLPERSGAALLRDWLLSQDGQAIITESGFVPVGD